MRVRTDGLHQGLPGLRGAAHPRDRVGESPAGVRGHDLEPYITLRYIAKLFKVLALLIIIMLVGEVLTGLLIDGTTAVVTLLGEGTRLLVMAGLLWAGGDLALLLIDAGHDIRVARILLGRINAHMHRGEPGAALLPDDRPRGAGRAAGPPAGR